MDKSQLEQLYLAYYKNLLFFALSLTKNMEDAEDLVSNAFVKAYLSFEKGNFKAWIYTVIKNEFLNEQRKKKRLMSVEDIPIDISDPSKDMLSTLIESEEKRILYRLIYMLESNEQKVMLLSMDASMTDISIGQVLGLSTSNVRVIRHRAKNKLIQLGKEYNS